MRSNRVTCRLFLSSLFVFASYGCSRSAEKARRLDEQLLQASQKPDLVSVQKLLKKGANASVADRDGWTPLMMAAGRGDVAMTKLLLDNGANYDANQFYDQTPLTVALTGARTPVLELLLDRGIDAKSKDQALFYIARSQPLLFKPAGDANPKVSDDFEPFEQVTALLLEKGARLDARDEEAATPLIVASAYGRLGTVKVLLEKGADLEARDKYQRTSLLAAACDCAIATMPDTYEVVNLLLEKGAKIDARDEDGDTPLMIASRPGVVKTKIVQLLIGHGANLHLKNNQGESAQAIAEKSDVMDVVRLLKAASRKRH